MILGLAQVIGLARSAGLEGEALATAAAIAGWQGSPHVGESGGNTNAVGDVRLQTSKWGPSVGVWQVRSLNVQRGTGQVRDQDRLSDPSFNARSMAQIYADRGNQFLDWTVFTNGTYQQNLATAREGAGVEGGAWWANLPTVGLPGLPGVGSINELATVARAVSSPDWWRRVGIGAAGVALVIWGATQLTGTSPLGMLPVGRALKAVT